MKRIILVLVLFAVVISGCKKFLDVPPKDKVAESTLFNNERGFMDAMTGVYLALDKPKNGGALGLYTNNLSMGLVSALAYNYDNASTPNAGTNGNFFNNAVLYAYNDGLVKTEIEGIWAGMYNTVANLNNLLARIDEKKGAFTRDNYYRVKGEAVGARALLHLDLLRMFGQSPLTGSTQRAIPYVRRVDIKSTPFSTLNQALDSCISDLHVARELLASTDTSMLYEAHQDLFSAYTLNHVNYWTVQALLARAHLYKGNADSASHYALKVIGSNKFPLISTNVASAFNAVRDRLYTQELLFAVYSGNVKNINSMMFDKSSPAVPLRLMPAGKNNLFTTGSGSNTDYRFLSWFDNTTGGLNVPSKYFQDANLPYAMQNNIPVVRVAEMYYIAAEAAAVKGDLSGGVDYLNLVRTHRGLTALDAAGFAGTDSLNFEIMREYQKEFFQEGQTFFYYKRLNKNLSQVTSNTAIIPAGAFTFPVPDRELEYNN